MGLEDGPGGGIEVDVAVVEGQHDGPLRKRLSLEVGSDVVEVYRVVVVPLEPVHLLAEIRWCDGQVVSQPVVWVGHDTDVVVFEDRHPDGRPARRNHLQSGGGPRGGGGLGGYERDVDGEV